MTPRRYERVTYRPEGGRARTVYLENPAESTMLGAPVLVGVEVDKEGENTDRTQVISVELIVRRIPMRMDLFYGRLVEATPCGTAS